MAGSETASDDEAGLIGPGEHAEPPAPLPALRPGTVSRGNCGTRFPSSAALVAQLAATEQGHPDTRARRRIEAGEGALRYRAVDALPLARRRTRSRIV